MMHALREFIYVFFLTPLCSLCHLWENIREIREIRVQKNQCSLRYL